MRWRSRGAGHFSFVDALLLQLLYGLSAAGLEEALGDRLSFRRFVGLSLEEATPDHTTLCRSRLKLIADLDRLISRRRAAVETTFATLKRRMGLTHIRYIGLTKANAQVILAAMAFNLRLSVTLSPA